MSRLRGPPSGVSAMKVYTIEKSTLVTVSILIYVGYFLTISAFKHLRAYFFEETWNTITFLPFPERKATHVVEIFIRGKQRSVIFI